MKWVCDVIMWSLKTRIEKSFSYSISYSYSNLKSPIMLFLWMHMLATIVLELPQQHAKERKSNSGVSLRAGHRANWPSVKMILPAWFVDLEESFSYKEVQFKTFCLSVKATCSPARDIDETPASLCVKFTQKLKLAYLGHSWSSVLGNVGSATTSVTICVSSL